jgi:hypothetical protein
MASEGESNSHRDSLVLHDRETTFRRLMGSQITSTLSTVGDLTTQSGGIWALTEAPLTQGAKAERFAMAQAEG